MCVCGKSLMSHCCDITEYLSDICWSTTENFGMLYHVCSKYSRWNSEQHVLMLPVVNLIYNLIMHYNYYSANVVLALPDKISCVSAISAVSAIPPIPLNLLSRINVFCRSVVFSCYRYDFQIIR